MKEVTGRTNTSRVRVFETAVLNNLNRVVNVKYCTIYLKWPSFFGTVVTNFGCYNLSQVCRHKALKPKVIFRGPKEITLKAGESLSLAVDIQVRAITH